MTSATPKIPNVAIVILNWNGWKDTVECLSSLMENVYQDFGVILVDNGSDDDSLSQINSWIEAYPSLDGSKPTVHWEKSETLQNDDPRPFSKIHLITLQENLGFAKGANVGIRYATANGFQYIMLLNNDTTLHPQCLNLLWDACQQNPQFKVLTPLICYHSQPEKVWMFGGSLTYTGRRKYHYGDQSKSKIKESIKTVTFVSGCALWTSTTTFQETGLLTEAFFFGEEDYDFSLRLKQAGYPIGAVKDAMVYHKIGQANKQIFSQDRLPYAFIGYLNRLLDRKQHSSSLHGWRLWRVTVLIYVVPKLIIIHRYPIKRIGQFLRLLLDYSNRLEGVSRHTFFDIKNRLG